MSYFTDRVVQVVNLIPKGKVASYGQVALMCGVPRAARQVGWVLHLNGDACVWWRVINNAGRISTNCMEHTALMQKKLLENDGIEVSKKLKIDIEKYRFRPRIEALKTIKLDDEYISKIIERYLS